MDASFSLHCSYHPERHGVAICVACRRTVCAECTTRFEGINHCSTCVSKLARAAPAAEPRTPGVLGLLGIAGTYLIVGVLLYVLGSVAAP